MIQEKKKKLKPLVGNKIIAVEDQPIFYNVLRKMYYVLFYRTLFLFYILIVYRIVFYISVCNPMLGAKINISRTNMPDYWDQVICNLTHKIIVLNTAQ